MDINKLMPKHLNFATSQIPNQSIGAPQREIKLQEGDESIVEKSISKLENSKLNTDELFTVFNDWQTKKTLTSKRVFLSTSILVASASWIGVDYTDLTLFGLKLSNGNPGKLMIFILISIVVSGVFYWASSRIDANVRKAKISHINTDLKKLKVPIMDIQGVIIRNNISSFSNLYWDFNSALINPDRGHNAIAVFNAVNFYNENLSSTGKGLNVITIGEMLVIYLIALYAVIAILISFQ